MADFLNAGLAIFGIVQDVKRAKQAHDEFRDLRNAREKIIKSSAPIRDRLFTDIEAAQRGELTGSARTRADEAIIQARAAGSRSEQQLRDQLARQGITGSFAQQALSEHRQRVEQQISSIEPNIIAELAGLAPGVGIGTLGAAQGFQPQGAPGADLSGIGALLQGSFGGRGFGGAAEDAASLGSDALTNLLGALRGTTKISGGSKVDMNWLSQNMPSSMSQGDALGGKGMSSPYSQGLGSNW